MARLIREHRHKIFTNPIETCGMSHILTGWIQVIADDFIRLRPCNGVEQSGWGARSVWLSLRARICINTCYAWGSDRGAGSWGVVVLFRLCFSIYA